MYRKICGLLACVGLCAGLALNVVERQARAEAPTPVVRTFGFVMDAGGALPPDYEGEDSIAVVALPNTSGVVGQMHFSDCESNGELRNTWWKRGSATHITRGGTRDQGEFMWLVTEDTPDVPPPGAVGFMGPAIDVQVYAITVCGSECTPSTSWHVAAYNATDIFVVVTAEFSK